jgi:hypothetical protein
MFGGESEHSVAVQIFQWGMVASLHNEWTDVTGGFQ